MNVDSVYFYKKLVTIEHPGHPDHLSTHYLIHWENMFKEELDDKLETAEELFELFNDSDKLKNYKYAEPVVGSTIDPEEFHLELPFKDIR